MNELCVDEQPDRLYLAMDGVMSKVNRDKGDREQITEHDSKRAVGFAASPVLPGESQEAFDCLLDELHDRYEPKGPVEEDAVDTMANAIWRKRNLKIFQRAFEARMKWGPYFAYPGDPNGFTRIGQAIGDRATAMMIEATTASAMERIEEELGEGEAHDKEKIEENARFGKSETESAKETSAITARKDIPEGLLKRIIETAAVEVKTARTKYGSAMNAKHQADIVKRVVINEWESEIATDKDEKPRSTREEIDQLYGAFDSMMGAVKTLLGADAVEEMCERMCYNHIEQSFAKLGDLLTPERYMDELRFSESLDLIIERTHDRLMKYQTARAKKAAADISSLQPDWARRKR
jgi:hypothetical protein